MQTNNKTLSDNDGFVKNEQGNPIQEPSFDQTGFYYSNSITMDVQLSPNQYSNLLKYGYAGKLHNVYYTVRSNNHAHLYAGSTEEINCLLELIS
ncbi:hypothetical protein AB3U99_21280 [Niallia sp. JL1B1071]|uniref:hypothetical protein n=1 Tax=Niallia tiangongensis TaxID=3237105 RepID=UPI0037DCF206